MKTNIEIDDALLEKVMKLAQIKTKKEAVHRALKAYLTNIKQQELTALSGKVKWEGNLDEMRRD
ncbi:MAG: type II toxin-antitoxin system VapB family antitoxin [Chitinophagales bacterium]